MKHVIVATAAAVFALSGCTGGENAKDAGANVDSSEVEITAPLGRDQMLTETSYNMRTETSYNIKSESGGTIHTDGM